MHGRSERWAEAVGALVRLEQSSIRRRRQLLVVRVEGTYRQIDTRRPDRACAYLSNKTPIGIIEIYALNGRTARQLALQTMAATEPSLLQPALAVRR